MDDIVALVRETQGGYDAEGNRIVIREKRDVYAQIYGVSRTEFYAAANAGLKPEITVRLQEFTEYEGEQLVEVNGELYQVIRVYRDRGSLQHRNGMDPDAVELILERKIGNGTA